MQETLQPIEPEPSLARRIFFGSFGLRAGWSLLIYFSIFATIGGGLYLAQHRAGAAHHDGATAGPRRAGQSGSAKPDSSKEMTVISAVVGEGILFVVLVLVDLADGGD